MKVFTVLLMLVFLLPKARSQASSQPFAFWNFDSKDPFADQMAGHIIKNLQKDCGLDMGPGKVGKGAYSGESGSCWFESRVLQGKVKERFSLSFYFKGDGFIFTTYPKRSLEASLKYPNLSFNTTFRSNGKEVSDAWIIPLTGADIHSYDYLADGNWHHILFTVDARTGKKEIQIDGKSSPDYKRQIAGGESLVVQNSEGFTRFVALDEISLYNTVVNPTSPIRELNSKAVVDHREYAPVFPNYTISLYEQLLKFPAPRYLPGSQAGRLFSWMDIQYLHRELQPPATRGFGKLNPEKAVLLSRLMADKWNYYLEVPLLYQDSTGALKIYQNRKTVPGALATFANSNPAYPVSTITYQTNARQSTAANLPARSYLSNKVLKPSVLPSLAVKDGQVTGYHLRQLKKAIGRSPAIINENGEVFGHFLRLPQLKQDQQELGAFLKTGLTESEYSGRVQFNMDSVYKATAQRISGTESAYFSFYNLSAIQPAYWPAYAMRRKLNAHPNGTIYPTPDFYPRRPQHWLKGAGAINGLATIAEGRKTEIEMGDLFFSPFVSAGWGDEQENIRPAQWLALLKAMVMLGADFFYVGYFNVTGKGGKWRDGYGPNDPRGYAYQVAMPSYAQAIRTLVPEFFTKGTLLNPQRPNIKTDIPFCFTGTAANDLILVRKLRNQFLIYGSIQPNSNLQGNAPLERSTRFKLENKTIELTLKRQGVFYVVDFSNSVPTIRQLDAWHQFEHPYYWSENIMEEAVNFTQSSGSPKRLTDFPIPGSFKSFKSVVEMNKGDLIRFQHLGSTPGRFKLELDYELSNPADQPVLKVTVGSVTQTITPGKATSIRLPEEVLIGDPTDDLSISVTKGSVWLKAIRLVKTK